MKYSKNIENNYLAIIINYNIEDNFQVYNNYMKKIWELNNIEEKLPSYKDEKLINEINDFIYWYGTIKYIYEYQLAKNLPNSYNYIENISADIENTKLVWYEIYYRYLLIYIDELFNSIFDKNYYGFSIHYRQIIELDMFLQTYHKLGENDKIFYGIINYCLYLNGNELGKSQKEIWSKYINFKELKYKFFLDKFYAHVGENDKIYYEEIVNNIDNKADKEITTNKILFSLRRKDKKISGISIEKEVESMLILYKLSTEDIEEKYGEPSKIIHPNSFYLLNKNQGNKFDLFFENNLELLIGRLSHINNIHIPVILNSFSGAKTNIY